MPFKANQQACYAYANHVLTKQAPPPAPLLTYSTMLLHRIAAKHILP